MIAEIIGALLMVFLSGFVVLALALIVYSWRVPRI